jgi:hypothetical protein
MMDVVVGPFFGAGWLLLRLCNCCFHLICGRSVAVATVGRAMEQLSYDDGCLGSLVRALLPSQWRMVFPNPLLPSSAGRGNGKASPV